MIRTQDGHNVTDNHSVFEITYRRYNDETSLAEPTMIRADEGPNRIWYSYANCKKVCDKINLKLKYPDLKDEPQSVKLLNEKICR